MAATIRGIDHVGLTVRDIETATAFLVEAFDAEVVYQALGRDEPPQTGHDLEHDTGVAPGTVMRAQRIVRIGTGPDVELFEMAAADQLPAARGSDIGLNHLALYVDDPEAAATRFTEAGGRLLSGP